MTLQSEVAALPQDGHPSKPSTVSSLTEPTDSRRCPICEEPLQGRSDKRYCSGACRVAAHRGVTRPHVTAKRQASVTAKAEPVYLTEQRLIGRRQTNCCDSCARPWTEVGIATPHYSDSATGTKRVRGAALCFDCNNGLVDPIKLVSGGEFATIRMEPIPCGECGGELSDWGLRRVYIDGAMLASCDACHSARSAKTVARAMGTTVSAAEALIAKYQRGAA